MALVANVVAREYVDLASLDVSGMPVGAFVSDVLLGNQFVLTVSTATVDHVDTESVLNQPALRWIKFTGGGVGTVTTDATLTGDGAALTPLSVVAADAWYNAQVTAMAALVPAITRYEYLKAAQMYPVTQGLAAGATVTVGVTSYVAGTLLGGSVGVASDSVYLHLLALPVWLTPRTDPWAVCFRAKFPAIASGKASYLGIGTGNGLAAGLGWAHGTSTTKWLLATNVLGTGTVDADTSWHNVIVASDGTTVTGKVDTGVIATGSPASITNTACDPLMFSSATLTPGVQVSRLIYGYVDPL